MSNFHHTMKCFFYLLLLVIFLCSTSSAKNAPRVHKTSGAISSQGDGQSNDYQISTKNNKANKNLKRPSPFKETDKSKRNKQTITKQNSEELLCGYAPIPIFNGTHVLKGHWPSMAAIFLNEKFICGGTVLNSRHILTAAHCISNKNVADPSGLSVVLGEGEIQQGRRIQPRERLFVRKVFKHKGYENKNRQHDIAILRMSWAVKFDDFVSPICLPNGFFSEDKFGQENGTILGWGKIKNPDIQKTKLQETSVSTLVNSACYKMFAASTSKFFGNTMICSNNPQQGFCSGGGGGPLFLKPGPADPWLQIGIISYGMGCLHPTFPRVYTRVTNYIDWIEEQINGPS